MATKSAALKKDTGKASTAVAVAKPKGGDVVDIKAIQDKLREQAASMGDRTAPPGGNKIIPAPGAFKLPDGSKVPELRACIVEFATVHSYYEKAFDPKNITPPGCFAVGTNPRDMAPVKESPNLQADNCQVCPMNEFGSAGEGKACKNGRRLALLPANEDGSVDASADLLVLDVSPTAIKGFDGYAQSIVRTFQMPPIGVVTTIGLDPSVDYAKLTFGDPQPYANLAEVMARQDEARDLVMAKPDFSGWVDPKAKAKPAAKAAGARR